MASTLEKENTIDEAQVRLRAYQMWDHAGRPGGRDMEFWLKAEEEIRPRNGTVLQNRTLTSAGVMSKATCPPTVSADNSKTTRRSRQQR